MTEVINIIKENVNFINKQSNETAKKDDFFSSEDSEDDLNDNSIIDSSSNDKLGTTHYDFITKESSIVSSDNLRKGKRSFRFSKDNFNNKLIKNISYKEDYLSFIYGDFYEINKIELNENLNENKKINNNIKKNYWMIIYKIFFKDIFTFLSEIKSEKDYCLNDFNESHSLYIKQIKFKFDKLKLFFLQNKLEKNYNKSSWLDFDKNIESENIYNFIKGDSINEKDKNEYLSLFIKRFQNNVKNIFNTKNFKKRVNSIDLHLNREKLIAKNKLTFKVFSKNTIISNQENEEDNNDDNDDIFKLVNCEDNNEPETPRDKKNKQKKVQFKNTKINIIPLKTDFINNAKPVEIKKRKITCDLPLTFLSQKKVKHVFKNALKIPIIPTLNIIGVNGNNLLKSTKEANAFPKSPRRKVKRTTSFKNLNNLSIQNPILEKINLDINFNNDEINFINNKKIFKTEHYNNNEKYKLIKNNVNKILSHKELYKGFCKEFPSKQNDLDNFNNEFHLYENELKKLEALKTNVVNYNDLFLDFEKKIFSIPLNKIEIHRKLIYKSIGLQTIFDKYLEYNNK